MEQCQDIDLHNEWGDEVTLTLWFTDSWELNFESDRFEAECVISHATIRIGNWVQKLLRPDLIKMIGIERMNAVENTRAETLERIEVAA